ncbi:CDF family Co(II)/Ni(II) efflux transporter DmeF [Sphingomonas qomolangmaensis]|uniref:CDF family Co(II)/Ni(II) efflux transporter DmeF n=1 Tax=Sphingomonas qomolangmaensis TaxID=2918765 RepID=A0ABY5L924_9SPHN|nr:CDF family Co(II)/Ni(II) efflux transporter DmeF [Sphingomonas qomolangmaensis]UUL82942.1 CDF family Co(II)/Ni(II) efflux transporter DmeF [Sphingomonas qomolangmaensis]
MSDAVGPVDAAHPCSRSHDYLGAAHDANARRTQWVVLLTAAMMVVEIVAGYATGSMALLADGFHMATHAGALGVAAIAYRYARRHAHDPRYSFGTGKVGDLAGFASALVLMLFAGGIALESARRLFDPGTVAFGEATVVAVVGLLVNLASALLLSGGHHHGHSHAHDHAEHDHAEHGHDHVEHAHGHGHDNNLRAAYLHVLADALTSVLAIVALLAGRYLGWNWLDPVIGIVGAGVIAHWSWGLLRDTAAVLLDTSDEALVADLRARVEAPGDVRVTDLHVWRIGAGARAAIVEVTGADADALARARLAGAAVAHLSVAVR